ncbi:uroporphyrinogen decarboxylase family protein [Eubacteriaceae bacterium ES3]|nr:uroporphyrinogen decarboxylase family protein [Eubacteriaceae bacterium ES3]
MTERENMELIFAHKEPDWIPHLGHDAYGIRDYIVERPIRTTGHDAFGCHWISCPTALGLTHPDTSDIKFEDIEDWKEKLQIPDLDKIDFAEMIDEAKTFTDRDKKMLQYVSLNGIFERSHILMGFENALVACMEEPEEFGEMLKALTDHKIRLYQKVYDICQPDILVYHDDMATQQSQFLATDFYKEYLFPQYKRIVEEARKMGYKYVVHHSCGKIEKLIPDWLSCGFDGWDSVMACNDLVAIKKEFGDQIVFMPGLDTQGVLGNSDSTRQEIEAMVVEWMNILASDGRGLIIDATPAYSLNPKNEEICLEFILKHGKLFMEAKKAGKEYVPELEK